MFKDCLKRQLKIDYNDYYYNDCYKGF